MRSAPRPPSRGLSRTARGSMRLGLRIVAVALATARAASARCDEADGCLCVDDRATCVFVDDGECDDGGFAAQTEAEVLTAEEQREERRAQPLLRELDVP